MFASRTNAARSRAATRRVAACLLSGLLLAGARPTKAQTLTVSGPPVLAWAAARIEAIDRDSLARALARAGLNMPSNIRVTLLADGDPRASGLPTWVLGVALPPSDVVILPQRAPTYPYNSLESVIRHEVAHLALAERAGGRSLPRWFHEGVAVSIEAGWGLTDQARLVGAIISQPGIGDVRRLFRSGEEPDSARAYMLATALVDDLRRRHDPSVIGAIASDVARGSSFDRAFTTGTGDTVAAATAQAWGAYLRWTRWFFMLVSPSSVWTGILALALLAFVAQRRRRIRRRRQWDDEDAEATDRSYLM